MRIENIIHLTDIIARKHHCFHDLFGIGSMVAGGLQSAANITSTKLTNDANKQIAAWANDTNLTQTRETNAANERMNSENNAWNYQLAREANELNYQMFQEQNDWNYNMWQEQNAYNDPSAQLDRLMAAGINPNMLGSSILGSSGSGNSQNLPSAAAWNGAEVATFNPTRFEAGHVDPYNLIPQNVDFLPAMAQAAGIRRTEAETDRIELDNAFNADTYATRLDAEKASTDFITAKLKDFLGSAQYRKSVRTMEIQLKSLEKEYKRLTNRSIKQEFDMRKDYFEWTKSLRPFELAKIHKSLRAMDDEHVLTYAQMKHWVNMDANSANLTQIQKDALRHAVVRDKWQLALSSYIYDESTRQHIAAALADGGDDGYSEFVNGLKGASDGNFNNWYSLVWKNRSSVLQSIKDYLSAPFGSSQADAEKKVADTIFGSQYDD